MLLLTASIYVYLKSIKGRHNYGPLFIPFFDALTAEIYNQVWKTRSQNFKIWKSSMEISKSDFISYRRNHPHTTSHAPTRHSQSDISLTLYYDNFKPPNIVTKSSDWIIWTSSNFLHNIPWTTSLTITQSSNFTDSLPGNQH